MGKTQLSIAELSQLLKLNEISDLRNLTSILRRHFNTSGDLSGVLDYDSLDMVGPNIQNVLVCIYSTTAIMSVAGNITAIVVLSLGKRSSGDLRMFLINLAVSDISMAIFSIPFTYTIFLLGRWIFHPAFCTVVLVMQHVSVIVSVYTLTAIGIDRYNAILHPFEKRLTKMRTKMIVACIWLVAVVISGGQMHVARAERFKYDGEWLWSCEEHWRAPLYGQIYTIGIFTVTFAVPLMVLAYTYSSIVKRMWLRVSPGNADPERDLVQLRSKRKVIKMLVIVVLLFAICWLPLQMFVFLYYFIPGFGTYRTTQEQQVYALTFVTCHWLANANSLVNPIVYCFMSDNFRADLKELLSSRGRSRNLPPVPRDSMSARLTTSCLVQRGSTGSNVSRRLGTNTSSTTSSDTKTVGSRTVAGDMAAPDVGQRVPDVQTSV